MNPSSFNSLEHVPPQTSTSSAAISAPTDIYLHLYGFLFICTDVGIYPRYFNPPEPTGSLSVYLLLLSRLWKLLLTKASAK